jgi:hypothetical protein
MRYRVDPRLEPLGGPQDWDHLKLRASHRVFRDFIFGGDSAPAPDPAIGQAALQEAELGKEMAGVARDQLSWNKEQYADLAPTLKKILAQQVEAGNLSADSAKSQWDHYEKTYLPVEKQMAKEAMAEGTPEQQEAEAATARVDVKTSFDNQRASSGRDLARMGVNPTSGRYASLERQSEATQAAAEAGAATGARTNARMRGIALRSGTAQFGRNMPQTGIAANAQAVSAGSSAANVGTGSLAAANAGVASAAPWFSGATAAYNASGGLNIGAYDATMKGYSADQQRQAGMWQGLGSGVGSAAALYMLSTKKAKDKTGDVSPAKAVAKFASLPVERWKYKKGAGDEGEHIGTYAEDFKKTFGVGDGKTISVIDAIGVTMAAVKGLAQKVESIGGGARFARTGVAA